MLRVALTGGIATGKSHVLHGFARLGAPTIDADRLAHDAVAPGSAALAAIARRFGAQVVTPDGRLDRKRVASVVFADPEARRDLEAIVHPEVYRRVATWFGDLQRTGAPLGIADIPLLFETGREAAFDLVVATICDEETQVRRLMSRDGMSEAEARQRLAAQWPTAEKARRADYVVETSGTIEGTDRQVERIWEALLAGARRP